MTIGLELAANGLVGARNFGLRAIHQMDNDTRAFCMAEKTGAETGT